MFHGDDVICLDTSALGTLNMPYARIYGAIDLGRRCSWPTPFYDEFVAGSVRVTSIDGTASWKVLTDATSYGADSTTTTIEVNAGTIRALWNQKFITDTTEKMACDLLIGDSLKTCIDGTVGTTEVLSIGTWLYATNLYDIVAEGNSDGYAGPFGVMVRDSSGG